MSEQDDGSCIDVPIELLNGIMECQVGECTHIERYFHPVGGLIKMQIHLEEQHGISESEFQSALEQEEVTDV